MENNWSTWILGSVGEVYSERRVIGIAYMSIIELFLFLNNQTKLKQGIILLKYHENSNIKLVSGLGSKSQLIDVSNYINQGKISPIDSVVGCDLLFIPYNGSDFPQTSIFGKLTDWAVSNKLPYIYLHDNDHIWFSNFSSSFEKIIFILFIKQSIFNILNLNINILKNDWQTIRGGIYEHGWTLNRLNCKYENGNIQYLLCAGIPENSIIQSNEKQKLSKINKGLFINIDLNDNLSISIDKFNCNLTDDYGIINT